ncbi:hypothetical protein DKX38_018200 [Salix brachista]|uniref:Uncharacterized protein n=1 Tax=Salix brachista TaxID=2182728 RepID=A0A5N5KMI6_9ROSI|nr:hypothetical protein DKX38_018200 [Salix brachista]
MKIWASTSEEGWLLPKGSDSLDCIQTLELKSSAEPGAEEASFNQVVALSQMGLILPANAKKNAIYVVHLDYGPNPASTRLDYISEFTVTMPILSLTGTSDVVHGQSVAQVYCVQTQAIQQTWTKLLSKAGIVTSPFTRQEFTIQTCAVACYSIAVGGGFGSYLLGLNRKTYEQAGVDTEGNTPGSTKEPGIGWMTGFLFVSSFVGLLALVPLRKIMIIDYKLSYPSGTATAVLINGFHTPTGDKMARKQVHGFMKFFSLSFLLAFFQWFYAGGEKCGFSQFPAFGLKAWRNSFYFDFSMTYIGAGMICSHLVNLSLLLGAVLSWGLMWPLIGDGLYNFLKILYFTARSMHARAKVNKLKTGLLESDSCPAICNETAAACIALLQAIGTVIGCVVAPFTFFLFYKAFDVGNPDGEYKAPYAIIYRNMAILGVEGFSALPQHCLQLCYGFFAFAISTNLSRDLSPKNIGKYVPLPMAMAVPFLVGAYFAIDMCLGSLVVFAWHKLNSRKASLMVPAVASGLICGDGLWILPSSILALAKIRPPICMSFQATN